MTVNEALEFFANGEVDIEPEALAARLGISVPEAFDRQVVILETLAPFVFSASAPEAAE